MSKKTINPGTQGRKNRVLKRPFDLTGINKIPIVGLCPVGKCPIREKFEPKFFLLIIMYNKNIKSK